MVICLLMSVHVPLPCLPWAHTFSISEFMEMMMGWSRRERDWPKHTSFPHLTRHFDTCNMKSGVFTHCKYYSTKLYHLRKVQKELWINVIPEFMAMMMGWTTENDQQKITRTTGTWMKLRAVEKNYKLAQFTTFYMSDLHWHHSRISKFFELDLRGSLKFFYAHKLSDIPLK